MGCGQSTDGQAWANSTKKVPLGETDLDRTYGYNYNSNIQNGQTNIDPTVSADVLEKYIALEEQIAEAEKDSPAMLLQQKQEQIQQLSIRIEEQHELVDQLTAQAATNQNVHDVMDKYKGQDAEKNKEKVAAVHSQEIASKELNSLQEQKNNIENEIRELEEKAVALQELYNEQEQLLSQIFGGAYGSEEENRLESILDQTEEMRNRIVEANFKWRQAQMMVDYAHKQLDFAVGKWKDINEIDASQLEDRYAVAAETRNNLVAASQNIQGAQRYLSNIQFPYCAPPEVDTLNKATAYIFTDMQTKDRHAHAMECYYVTARRCGALLQWISQVVNQTIARDLDDINGKVKEASKNLRAERVKLIKAKVKEVLGKDVDIDVKDVNTDVIVNLNLNALAKTEGIDPKTLQELNLSKEEMAHLASLTNDDLAPQPSTSDIFGAQMEVFKQEYEEDTNRYEKILENDRNEVQKSLQDKLAARRQRRARKKIEEKELEKMRSRRNSRA